VAEVLATRLLLAVPMLFGMSVVVFLIMRLVPGDPALAVLGLHATPQLVDQLHREFGLDQPIYAQYFTWLGDVAHGQFGHDYRSDQAIGHMLWTRLPVTAELAGMALLIGVLVAIPLGTAAAVWRGRAPDKAVQGVSMLGLSVPDFWLGIILILLFSLSLRALPSSGFVPLRDDPVENLKHMILPALSLAVGLAAVLVRVTRTAMADVLQQDFVRFCRSKGISEASIVFKHALRNAAVPIVTVIGMQAGYLLGGAIVIEQLFSLPGVGQLVLDAVLERNYPVVQAAVLMIGLLFIAVNLAADLLYTVLNPKLRTAS
jgi:peptide/nickel transport system permease protein